MILQAENTVGGQEFGGCWRKCILWFLWTLFFLAFLALVKTGCWPIHACVIFWIRKIYESFETVGSWLVSIRFTAFRIAWTCSWVQSPCTAALVVLKQEMACSIPVPLSAQALWPLLHRENIGKQMGEQKGSGDRKKTDKSKYYSSNKRVDMLPKVVSPFNLAIFSPANRGVFIGGGWNGRTLFKCSIAYETEWQDHTQYRSSASHLSYRPWTMISSFALRSVCVWTANWVSVSEMVW